MSKVNIYLLTLEISAAVCIPGIQTRGTICFPFCTSHNICDPNFTKTTEPFVGLLQQIIVEFKWKIDTAFQEQYDCSDL